MKRILTLSFISLLLTLPAFAQDDVLPPLPEDEANNPQPVTEDAADNPPPLPEDAANNPQTVTEDAANNPPTVPEAEADVPPFVSDDEENPELLTPSDAAAPIPQDEAEAAPNDNVLPVTEQSQMAQQALEEGDKEVAQQEEEERLKKEKEKEEMEAKKNQGSRIDFLELIKSGGVLMWPLGALSVLGLMFILERFLALRYNAIMPRRLFKQITPYLEPSKFSPMAIWAICKKYRSPAARVIQAALLKIGRPLPEVISAVEAAKQDEASNLYRNVGWLTLVSSLAPLLGLLGTVWGMIQAFHRVASLEIGANRAEQLSSGIYVALVTTAAGLAIAIPVALFAHFFESRILKAFHKLDAKLLPLLDIMEKQEGKPRISLAQYQAKK